MFSVHAASRSGTNMLTRAAVVVSALTIGSIACSDPASSPKSDAGAFLPLSPAIIVPLSGRVELCVSPLSPVGSYTFRNTSEIAAPGGVTWFNVPQGVPYQIVTATNNLCVDIVQRTFANDPPFDPYSTVVIVADVPGYVTAAVTFEQDYGPPGVFTPPATASAAANWNHGTRVTYTFTPDNNTPTGNGVIVAPVDPAPIGNAQLSLTFDNVGTGGITTVTSSLLSDPSSPLPPSGFQFRDPAVVYDIRTDAAFSGSIQVCLDYSLDPPADDTGLRLLHYDNGQWIDITSAGYPNSALHLICGLTSSLSPFMVGLLHYDVTGFFKPVDNLPSVNAANAGSAIPIKFGLGGDRGSNVFAAHYPQSRAVACDFSSFLGSPEETVAGADVNYAPGNDQYMYLWKTSNAWRGTCRELTVRFADGQQKVARFQFK